MRQQTIPSATDGQMAEWFRDVFGEKDGSPDGIVVARANHVLATPQEVNLGDGTEFPDVSSCSDPVEHIEHFSYPGQSEELHGRRFVGSQGSEAVTSLLFGQLDELTGYSLGEMATRTTINPDRHYPVHIEWENGWSLLAAPMREESCGCTE